MIEISAHFLSGAYHISLRAQFDFYARKHDENERPFASPTSTRQAQDVNDPYFIPQPSIHWNGFRLNIDYAISAAIGDSFLGHGIFSDKECTREIPDSDAMDIVLLTDSSLFSEEELSTLVEGTRLVRLTLLINPNEIRDVRFISFSDDKAVVSFSSRLWVKGSQETGADRIDFLMVEVDLDGATGILSLLPDESSNWGVDVFRCDAFLERTTNSSLPVKQGERVRICLTPNEATRNEGVYLSSIKYFDYERGGIVQNAVTPGQLSGDDGLTEILCKPGGTDLCAIDSVLYNEFFESPGQVQGTGLVFLQFGVLEHGQRYLRRKGVNIELAKENGRMRSLYEQGDFIGEKTASYQVQVEPSNELFSAEAFRCNHKNERLTDSNAVSYGESVRICVQADERAREAGIFIRRIASFSFHQRDGANPQVAIDSSGKIGEDGKTLMICSRGEEMCSIKTVLANWFFLSNGLVEVTGNVVLQYGTQKQAQTTQIRHRGLQDYNSSGQDSDPGFAGTAEVTASFNVAFSSSASKNPRLWWNSSPAYMKALYVLAIALCCLIIFCCIFGCIFFCCHRRKGEAFVMNEIFDVHMRVIKDDSVDARVDSKASFYSDLEFDTDAEDNSSDEESISEKFEDDLEDKVAILFPSNPDPDDLSHSLASNSTHADRAALLNDKPQARHDPTTHSAKDRRGSHSERSMSLPPQPILAIESMSEDQPTVPERALSVPSERQGGSNPPENKDPFSQSLDEQRHGPKLYQQRPSLQAKQPRRQPSLQEKQRFKDSISQSEHGTAGVAPRGRPAKLQSQQRTPLNGKSKDPSYGTKRGTSLQPRRTDDCHLSKSKDSATHRTSIEATQTSSNAPQKHSAKRQPMNGRLSQSLHGTSTSSSSPKAQVRPSMQGGKQQRMNDRLSKSEHETTGRQRFSVPKGRKTIRNTDVGHHPDGFTSVTRIERTKASPQKHPPSGTGSQVSKKNGSRSSGASKAALKKKKELPNAAKATSRSPTTLISKKQPDRVTSKFVDRNGSEASTEKKSSISPAKSKHAAEGGETVQSTSKKGDTPKVNVLSNKSTNNKETPSNIGSISSTDGGSTELDESSEVEDDIPNEEDVCFEAEEHPGTDAFLNAVRKTLKSVGPSAYSPKVYRQIKRQLVGRRFFVCDDDNKPYDWREVNKSELIDLVWKYYEDIKSQMYGVRIEEA
jgi:hypothetical protein